MSLDIHWGVLSIVKILIYVPILFLLFLVFRKQSVKAPWFLLFVFSLVRVAGSAVMIAAERTSSVVDGLYLAGYALDASGFSILLMCTLSLLEVIAEGPYGQKRILRILGMYVIGIASMSNIIAAIAITDGIHLFLGTIILVGLCALLVFVVVVVWIKYHLVLEYRRKLLVAVSISLPFLAVRAAYSMLSIIPSLYTFGIATGFPPQPLPPDPLTNVNPGLDKFDMFTGAWQIYLVMAVIMEYAAVMIYTVAGTALPLDRDYLRRNLDEF